MTYIQDLQVQIATFDQIEKALDRVFIGAICCASFGVAFAVGFFII
jgi:hypothetical protein